MNNEAPSLKGNVAALGILQIANLLIPLATIPFLTRILGVESFGKIALVQVTMQFCILFADYGFSWYTTNQIAARRADHTFVSKTFFATWAAQWFLLLVTASVLYLSSQYFEILRQDWELFSVGLLILIGHVMFPLWLLQGLERLMAMAVIQLTTRLATLPLLFVFVATPEDARVAILIIGLAPVLAGAVSIAWIFRQNLVSWQPVSIFDVSGVLKDGAGMFVSKLSISVYAQLVPMLVGILSGATAMAYFSLADRSRRAVQSMLLPLAQAMFPRMSYLFANAPKEARSMLRISIAITMAVSVSASCALWFGADLIVLILGGEEFKPAAQVIRWMAIVPVAVGLSNILGTQIMIPRQMNKAFNGILSSCALGGLVAAVILIPEFGEIGGAMVLLGTEVSVTLLMLIILVRKGFLKTANAHEN